MRKNRFVRIDRVCFAIAFCAMALTVGAQSGWETLTFVEVQTDGDGGVVEGLDGAQSVAVEPNGKHIYVAGLNDNAVAVFDRDYATGSLTFVESEIEGAGGVSGLHGASAVTVSPDGGKVFVAAYLGNSVAVFSRDTTTGALSFSEAHFEGDGGVVDGLTGATAIAASPDDGHVYVAGYYESSIAVFTRKATGADLAWVQVVKDGAGGVSGLSGPHAVAVSPDGGHVYATGRLGSTVAVFSRNATLGTLTYVEKHTDGIAGVDGLGGAYGVALSPDGRYVYVGGTVDNAVAVFSRNPSTGALSFLEVHKDGVGGVDGLAGARDVKVAQDGQHVYVTGFTDDAVTLFSRNPSTGRLAFVEVKKDGAMGVDGLEGATGVAVVPDSDSVYVAGKQDDALAVFWSNGPEPKEPPPSFIKTWGSQGSGTGEFFNPTGVATGSLYVADLSNHRIQKFDHDGNYVTEWGSDGSGNGSFHLPADVAVGPTGKVYVADFGNDRVQVFTADGTFDDKWGATGTGTGEFNDPFGIAVDAASNVYVVDRGNHRIQKFNESGDYVTEWGSLGSGPGQFMNPHGVVVGPNGDVYVTDGTTSPPHLHRIQRFTSTGELVAMWGAGPSSPNGRLDMPVHPGVDRDGNIYVPNGGNYRVQKYDADGNFLVSWDTGGSGLYFVAPGAVAVDASGRIYVADTGNHRIQIFAGPYLEMFIGDVPSPPQALGLSRPKSSVKVR